MRGQTGVFYYLRGTLKLLLASLIAGTFLSFFGLTPIAVLEFLGVTPEEIQIGLYNGFAWAAPRALLGAMLVLPVWFVTYILMPPPRD